MMSSGETTLVTGEVLQIDENLAALRVTPAFTPTEHFLEFMQDCYATAIECELQVITATTTVLLLRAAIGKEGSFKREIHELLQGLLEILNKVNDFSDKEWYS